ncbi:MAG TPA: DUF748 domain-containing protein, partial [Geobacteraceae bacterium]|nr:DUF748 domain-containing protein [Geobacteraceae bacterium]
SVLLLFMAFIAFILPGIIRSRAIEAIEKATGRKAAIARVTMNPLTWTARVEGFRLMEKQGNATFVSFSSVRISVSPKSLYRFAPIVGEAHISSPYFHIVRTAANTYNFSDLMEGKKEPKEKSNGKLPRFSVNNITIDNGSIDFIDQALPAEKRHELRRIEIGIPFISNIKYLADRYVQPHFSAVVNGAPLNLEGKLKPFKTGAETTLNVNLRELSLPRYLTYYPGTPPIKMDSGSLSTNLEIVHRISQEKNPELEIRGNIYLDRLAVSEPGGAPLVSLYSGEARISRAEVLSRDFALSRLSADGLELNVTRGKDGVWNFQRIVESQKKPKESEPSAKTTVSVDVTTLTNGRLLFSDDLPPGGFSTDVEDMTFDMRGFSTARDRKGSYTFSFNTTRGEKGAVDGTFSIDPLMAETSLGFNDILLDAYYPYLAGELTVPVKGRLDVVASISLTPSDGLKVGKLAIETRDVSVPFGKDEGLKLARAIVSGGSASLKERSLEVESVELQNASIKLSRDARGKLSPLALLKETKKGKPPAKKEKEAAAPFKFRVKSVSGAGMNITFTDRMKEDSPVFNLKNLQFNLTDVTGPRFSPIPFKLAAEYGRKGTISVSGDVDPEPLRFKGTCALHNIPLGDFDPYLPDDLNITIAGGNLDTKLSLNLAQTKGEMKGSFRGSIGVRSLHTLDAENEDLLNWESLHIDSMSGTLVPFSLDIAGVALSKLYSRIVVEKDGTLNLQELRAPEKKGEAPQPGAPAQGQAVSTAQKPARAAPPAPAGPGKIKVGTVTMQDGTILFIDHHSKPEYSSTMVNLGGRISGLSSAADTLADVDLRGNLENQSPLRITGQINPLRDSLFADLKVSFNNIELSPFTPYAGTYLGYSVDKGKLYLDLKYRIENKKLDSSNKVFIDQLTFGKKIESDKATSLPVRLAVALLKDRKGEIHLDIPVTGRTDDPQFSVWSVIFHILKNLLVKAATSPFTLFQSLFGGKEDFNSVFFSYGSARLSEPEKGKLVKLAQIITDRPALKVEVSGFVDKERDPEGYRVELLQKKMKTEKFLALVKEKKAQEGQSADNMEILPNEYSTYLKIVYRKEKFPKPRNFIGLVKDLPDDEMKKLILTHTIVGDEALQGLARDRATTVRNYLMAEGKLPPERIFEKMGDIYKAPAREGVSAARVDFGATVQ